ncbi:ankyrin repeat-containing domain protein [Thelonectria olida]|uniref:Ankyrin repeat-containing domain protein n=1 Tax=Thelonectria olida TaxID=1576542 RepID=A0A9P9AGM4_9HYPO|nr:ankyrin repeat-containing domain protein [Thelonectria olida]
MDQDHSIALRRKLRHPFEHLLSFETPKDVIRELLGTCYSEIDENLHDYAIEALFMLQTSSYRGKPEWNEAVAISLMAQRRYDEATEYYTKLDMNDTIIHNHAFLVAVRFGWPPSLGYPCLPSQPSVRNKAFIGAACVGDLEALIRLLQNGVPPGLVVGSDTAATVAAAAGHVHILEFLHAHKVDLLSRPSAPSPLLKASSYGQGNAAKFLLSIGDRPDIEDGGTSPYKTAATRGHVDILRLFLEHTPSLGSTLTSEGNLSVAPVFDCYFPGVDQRIRLLNYFVNDVRVDINAVDSHGHGAIHLAVEHGSVDLVQAVVASGANLHILDAAGQSPMELAVNNHEAIAEWLSEQTGLNAPFTRTEKKELAKTILEATRHGLMRMLALGNFASCFEGTPWIEEGMDDEVADIWVREFSFAAMKDYIEQVMGTNLKGIVDNILLSISTGSAPSEFQLKGTDKAFLSMAQKVVTDLFPHDIGASDRLARAILHELPIKDLHQIAAHGETPFGKLFSAGRKAGWNDELLVVLRFVEGR